MKKKYTMPKIDTVKFEIEDIIQTSSVIVEAVNPKITFSNAVKVENQKIDIFD